MTDPSESEIEAMLYASEMAGEYIESLKTTDLAKMTENEFMTLIEVIVTGYQDKHAAILRTMVTEGIPF